MATWMLTWLVPISLPTGLGSEWHLLFPWASGSLRSELNLLGAGVSYTEGPVPARRPSRAQGSCLNESQDAESQLRKALGKAGWLGQGRHLTL